MKTMTRGSAVRAGALLIVSLLLLTQVAGASPQAQQIESPSQTLLSYQGTLTDEDGNPINATVTMKFALYDAASDGNLKWGTQTQSVQVTDGLFSVLLGTDPTIDPDDLTGDLWLDIIVNDERLTPRERITSVVYATEAGTLPAGAETRGSLQVNGNLFQVVGQNWMGRIDQVRTDEQGREHRWTYWHMNQDYGMNSLQLYEYRTDSNGVSCGGNPDDGAICAQRLSIDSGGDVCIGCGEGGDLTVNGNVDMQGNLDVHGNALLNVRSISAGSSGSLDLLYMQDNDVNIKAGATTGGVYIGRWGYPVPLWVNGNGEFTGNGFFGGATFAEGAMNLQSIAVPLTFKESDASGQGSLWRMPLDGTNLRFDSSDNGVDFSAFHTPITMYPTGGVGCGAVLENNLQTPEEQAAGRSDRFEEGDVLCWSAKTQRLEKCATPNDALVQAVADAGGRPIVIGAEVVKVIGPVRAGDYLVASSVPGYAMASPNPTFGIVIAQALEDFDGDRGVIKAMIRKM